MTKRAPLSVSTCWNSGRHTEGDAMLKEIRDLGFEYAELSHGIRYSLWPGVLKAAQAGVIKISSVHNFCPVPMGIFHPSPNCYQFSDAREFNRTASIRYTKETIEHAQKLGAAVVVLHLGWAGPKKITKGLEELFKEGKLFDRKYVATKVQATRARQEVFPKAWARIKECLDPIVEFAAQHKIRLGFECRELFEEFPNEIEMTEVLATYPTEAVGYWHDFGHAARKEFLGWHTHEESLIRFRDRLCGCHIHDCLPPHVDHLALGKGEIDFKRLAVHVSPQAVQVLELSPRTKSEEVEKSRDLWHSFVGI